MGTEAPAKTLPIETQESYKIKLLLLVNMLFAISIFLGCGLEVWTGALQDCRPARGVYSQNKMRTKTNI